MAEATFLVDVHPSYQAGLDFRRVKELGYKAAICKASQGGSYVPPGLADYFGRIKASALLPGLYHFLDSTASGKAQAEHFLRRVDALGGPDGMLLAADFEHYGEQSPSNRHLADFVAEVKRRTDHPMIVYTAASFWNSGDPSGAFSKYGGDALWAAHYADMARHDRPQDYFRELAGWGWDTIGGKRADIHQFTSAGLVAGQYVDVNATDLGSRGLVALADAPDRQKGEDVPDKTKTPAQLAEGAIAFGLKMLGAPYGTGWEEGTWPALSPLYARIGRHDDPAWYRQREIICAGFINVLRFEVAGLPAVGRAQGDAWPGGTAAIGRHLAFAEGSRPYPPVEDTPRGWLVFAPYLGPALAMQGHVGVALGNGYVLEARVPTLSKNRTENDGCVALKRGGAKPYTRIIPPSVWLRK